MRVCGEDQGRDQPQPKTWSGDCAVLPPRRGGAAQDARAKSGSLVSVLRKFAGCISAGVCGVAEEVGDQFEFGVAISGKELVHRAVHSRVETHQVAVAGG